MQFLKFTATLTDKEWIKGNKDRETYRDHKAEICDRTASRNEGKEDIFFITDMQGTRIRGAALVTDGKNNRQRVETFLRKICVSADVSALSEITFTDWRQRLGNACRGDYIEDRERIMENTALDPLTDGYRGYSFREFMFAGDE